MKPVNRIEEPTRSKEKPKIYRVMFSLEGLNDSQVHDLVEDIISRGYKGFEENLREGYMENVRIWKAEKPKEKCPSCGRKVARWKTFDYFYDHKDPKTGDWCEESRRFHDEFSSA